ERSRDQLLQWLVECISEAMGTFLFAFAGTGAAAVYTLGNILQTEEQHSDIIYVIGLVCAVVVALALSVCLPTRGQFNPSVTIHAVVFRSFPPQKALRYIAAQVLGAYIACIVVSIQYRQFIDAAIKALESKGVYESTMYTPSGPAGVFGSYMNTGTNFRDVFIRKFILSVTWQDFVYGFVIFATTHPGDSPSTPVPTAMPWLTSMIYGVVVWGSSSMGLATNPARDLGGRLAALTLFGRAADHGSCAMLAALTSIPATLLAGVVYKRFYGFVFDDPDSVHGTHLLTRRA
ncbi:aquaporin-like protein, partial [Cubamyces lactineus]